VAGALEPVPEGIYRDLGPVEWAGGHGNYAASWGTGLGPVWITIEPVRAIGFHLDANASTSPGSAGCVVLPDEASLRALVAWLSEPVELLAVDWGLGTVPAPVPVAWIKLFRKSQRMQAWHRGEHCPSGHLEISWAPGALSVSLDGQSVAADTVDVQISYRRKRK